MSRFKALLISFFTVWPLAYSAVFVIVWFISFAAMQSGDTNAGFPGNMVLLFGVHALTMLLGFVMLAFYCFQIFENDDIDDDKKLIWFLVVFLTGPFGQMFYWYKFIWSQRAGQFERGI